MDFTSSRYQEVDTLCKNVRQSNLLCPFNDCGAGLSNYAEKAELVSNSSWLVRLSCPICKKSWHVCRLCRGQYNLSFVKQQQIARHRYNNHRDKESPLEQARSQKSDMADGKSPTKPVQSQKSDMADGNSPTKHHESDNNQLKTDFKALLAVGMHPVQQEAQRIRSLCIPPAARRLLHIHEPNILYQGDTVVIWDIRAYARNAKWREEATRRALKRRKLTSQINKIK
jgi:hypothetical protein